MKKYSLAFLVALIVGFFLAKFFINQYKDYNGIKVSNKYEELYFIQYGVFSSVDSMEKNTISLQNYVYNEENDLYYVYVGITKNLTNVTKIQDYFKNKGYDTFVKKYGISNNEFINILENYDSILENASDEVVIASMINQVLSKYEEVVINGN